MLIVASALQSFRPRQKGPIESAFLLLATLIGLTGLACLEIWPYLQSKKHRRGELADGGNSALPTSETVTNLDWMGTPEGRKRRLTMTICLVLALVGAGIVILNLTH